MHFKISEKFMGYLYCSYMKFTKGKDLSHHSNKDLACILGPSRSANATPLNSAPQSKVGCSFWSKLQNDMNVSTPPGITMWLQCDYSVITMWLQCVVVSQLLLIQTEPKAGSSSKP